MSERYSIEVYDDSVEIYGELTIEETFDFLSFFEKKGYKSVILGTENSTLHLLRRDQQEVIHDQFILTLKEQITDYKEMYDQEKKSHLRTMERLKTVECLMKELISEEHSKYKKLHEENMKLLKDQCIKDLSENSEVQKIVTTYLTEDRALSRPMTEEEKKQNYEKLNKIKTEYPHIPIPDPTNYPPEGET